MRFPSTPIENAELWIPSSMVMHKTRPYSLLLSSPPCPHDGEESPQLETPTKSKTIKDERHSWHKEFGDERRTCN